MNYPMGILENVSVKVGDFYMHDDFIVLDMAVDVYAHIILDPSKPLLDAKLM